MFLFARAVLLWSALAACAPHEPFPARSGGWGRPGHGGGWGGKKLTPQVDLGYSKYEGIPLSSGVLQWLGIAYAAPPLGDLRWRAPQDPVVNDALQPAYEFKPTCLGLFGPGLSDTTNEDCLYLDVFAPANATTESKLPVWFFIQGGGYAGDTDENFNFTEVLVNSGYNMVAVQINYRVGAFGFLASEEIRQNGDLNVGLLDQRKAMNWVQEYIHLFGGDKDHVVIHGDSAGAGSVAFHLSAYGGRDDSLFIGAIIESSFWPTHRQVSQMEGQFQRFAANVSCAPSQAPNRDILSCLRSKDTATLQSADIVGTFPHATGPAEWWFLPVVDGVFSVDYLYNLFSAGRFVRVPLMVGDDTNEGSGFSPDAANATAFLSFISDNFPNLTPADLRAISASYPPDAFGSFLDHAPYFAATQAAYGESTFTCPGIHLSRSVARFLSPAKVWNYRYNVQDATDIALGLGVPHVSEKPAIWGPNNAGPCGDPCSYESYNAPVVPIMMDFWISFLLTLDPNPLRSETAPEWESWLGGPGGGGWGPGGGHGAPPSGGSGGDGDPQRMRIQLNATGMEKVPSAQLQRCDLWKSLAGRSQQ